MFLDEVLVENGINFDRKEILALAEEIDSFNKKIEGEARVINMKKQMKEYVRDVDSGIRFVIDMARNATKDEITWEKGLPLICTCLHFETNPSFFSFPVDDFLLLGVQIRRGVKFRQNGVGRSRDNQLLCEVSLLLHPGHCAEQSGGSSRPSNPLQKVASCNCDAIRVCRRLRLCLLQTFSMTAKLRSIKRCYSMSI